MPKLFSADGRSVLDYLIGIALIAACGSIVYKNLLPASASRAPVTERVQRPEVPLPKLPIDLANGHREGSESAKVVVLTYSDFLCPFCGQFARESLPAFRAEYVDSGRVAMYFKHLPLESIHPAARGAAQLTECAAEQGQFWPAHDALFAAPFDGAPEARARIASAAKLNRTKLFDCEKDVGVEDVRINQHIKEAKGLGVSGTPTFFLGYLETPSKLKVVTRLVGAQTNGRIESEVERLLATASR
jgi:protein-disulfide isomerase